MGNPAKIALAPIFWGNTIACGLYGIFIMQFITYFRGPRAVERRFVQYVVCLLFILEAVRTILGLVYLYRTLILKFGDAEAVMMTDWTFSSEPAFTSMIAGIVQLFYAWRVHVITKKLYLTFPVVLGAVAGTAFGIKAAPATPGTLNLLSGPGYLKNPFLHG